MSCGCNPNGPSGGGGGGAVASVFGRTGNVVAVADDYAASQIFNDGDEAGGATVKAALDELAVEGQIHDSQIGALQNQLINLNTSNVANSTALPGVNSAEVLQSLSSSLMFWSTAAPATTGSRFIQRIGNFASAESSGLFFAPRTTFVRRIIARCNVALLVDSVTITLRLATPPAGSLSDTLAVLVFPPNTILPVISSAFPAVSVAEGSLISIRANQSGSEAQAAWNFLLMLG